jgi:GntR family transcriptional regulator of arabinose operon
LNILKTGGEMDKTFDKIDNETDKNQNTLTKYQEVEDYILALIEDGTIAPEGKLPSENELSAQFDVSRQTVRRAIGELETRQLVKRVRGSGTYLIDRTGKNRGKCNRVSVVTTYVDSYIFPKIIQGIEKKLSEKGFLVQIAFTNNTLEREKSILQDIIKRDDVAGVIVEGTKSGLPNPNINLYRQLMKENIPVIFINTYYPELDAPHVSLDDAGAARKAVEYLIDKGHCNIGAILKLDDGQGRLRYLGYLQAMEKAGLAVTDSRMVWIDTDESKQLAYCTDKIMNRLESCSALFCYNDQIAFQLIRILNDRGIRVPEDVAVISIDDSDLCTHSEVQITSLPHPKEKLGEKAAELLTYMINSGKMAESCEFDTRIIERASV